jgi:hypothetical protein
MTTNVPQDVIEELEKISQDIASAGINGFGNRINDAVSKLRAQRQQGAEPVAPYCYAVVAYGNVQQTAKREDVAFEMAEKASDNCIDGVVEVVPLYTTPPQANDLVAAFGRKAAEILIKAKAQAALAETMIVSYSKNGGSMCGYLDDACTAAGLAETDINEAIKILSAIPADAEAQGVDELSRYERIGLAASCCRTIRFQEGGPVYDAAGGIMDSHEPEAEVRSGSGQMFRAETIADALLKMYEAEFVDPDAVKPSSDKVEEQETYLDSEREYQDFLIGGMNQRDFS